MVYMRILSIDVGMKNLAYCYLTIDDNTYKIEDWDVIDLCESNNRICEHINKTKKKGDVKCEKPAKFSKFNKFYCKLHSKKTNFKIPTQELNINKLNKLKTGEVRCLMKKYDISGHDLKLKKSQYLESISLDLSNNYLDFIQKKNASEMSMIYYGIKLRDIFKEKFKEISFDKILIENQIGPIALRMKTLQGMIIQHFIENKIENIECINSSNKLKNFIGKKKTSYNERKKFSIKYTREILEINNNINKWLEHYNKHKKKDDLADCFLQCLWYMKEKNLIKEK